MRQETAIILSIRCPFGKGCGQIIEVDLGYITLPEPNGTAERAAEIEAKRWLHFGRLLDHAMLDHAVNDCPGDGTGSRRHLRPI